MFAFVFYCIFQDSQWDLGPGIVQATSCLSQINVLKSALNPVEEWNSFLYEKSLKQITRMVIVNEVFRAFSNPWETR